MKKPPTEGECFMKKKETIIYAVIMGALVALSAFLLKGDALVF